MLTEIKDFFNGLTGASLMAITVLSVVVLAVAGFIATAYPLVSLVAALLFAAYLVPNLFDKFSTALGWLATAAKDLLVALVSFIGTIATTLLTLLKEIVLGVVGLMKELLTCLAKITPYVIVAALIALLFVTISPHGSYHISLPRVLGGAELQKRESPRAAQGGVNSVSIPANTDTALATAGTISTQTPERPESTAQATAAIAPVYGGNWRLSVLDNPDSSPFGKCRETITARMGTGGNNGHTVTVSATVEDGGTVVMLWNPKTNTGGWSKTGGGGGSGHISITWLDRNTIGGVMDSETEFRLVRNN